jgi:purine-binding chemotaxis protein CheW
MSEPLLKILTVTIGQQLFGIEAEHISSIMERTEGTEVPQAGSRIAGLINMRGRIVTMVDVRECLGMTSSNDTAKMNVSVEEGGEMYGMLFDSVDDILELPPEKMEPVPAVLDARWNGIAKGIYRLPENLLIVLDTEKLVTASWPEGTKE